MGDNMILLTYIKDGICGFDWFNNKEDMEISIIERGIKKKEIRDMIKIECCRELELSDECKAFMDK